MVKSAYQRWLKTLDREQFDALTDRKVWLFILFVFVVIIALASHAPWVGDYFGMRFWPALLSLLPVALCALAVSAKPLEKGMRLEHWGVLILVTTGAFQFFMWALVCFSAMPGATAMAALPILLCAYHGESYRFSKKYLWWGLSFIPALLLALLIAPTQEHQAVLAISALIACAAAGTMGNYGVMRAEALRERDALKAAIDAQALLDSVREIEEKQHLLYELRGTNHDAGNALSGVLMNLDFLSDLLNQDQFSEQDINTLRDMNHDLQLSTRRLRELIEKGRDTGKQAEAKEAVNVLEVVQQIADEVQRLHPDLHVDLDIDPALRTAPIAHLHGGQLALYRVLQNIVKNASEGNGQQAASAVEIVLTRIGDHLLCRVLDNGPGFAHHQLDESVVQLATTKENGTGLGLYTSQRLLLANHGKLTRSNRPSGGAEVSIQLPLESHTQALSA